MLRLINVSGAIPHSFSVDPSAVFLPGNFAQLTVIGNQVCATLSNGLAPFGIIDDIKTNAFTAVSWDETIIVPANGVFSGDGYFTTVDITVMLKNPNVVAGSFVSIPVDVQLIPRNGVVIFPAGTRLNLDDGGVGFPNAIKTNVRYTFQIPMVLGDDSTAGTQRVTVWYQRGIYQTDVFQTSAAYPLNCNLFVNDKGQLTSIQSVPNAPSVALCTAPPSPLSPMIEFLLL